MYGAGFQTCSFVLCGFGNILDGYTFSCVCLVITSAFGYLNIPNEFVMDHNSLTTVFANTFGFINRYLVYEFPKKRCSQFLHFHKSSDSSYKSVFVLLHRAKIVYDAFDNIAKIESDLPKTILGKRKIIVNYETEYR